MVNLKKIYKRKIGIFGKGETGKKTERTLKLTYNKTLIYDDKIRKLNKIVYYTIKKLDFLIVSPGISKKHKIFKVCQLLNIPIYIDIDLLFFAAPKASYLTITGTNGKSTNSIFLYNTLKYNKIRCSIGGNIGIAVLGLKHYYNFHEYYIIELSSYQLEIINNYKFKIRILLSINPDHLNRHNSVQEYIEQKLKILNKIEKEQVHIISIKNRINKKITININNNRKYLYLKKQKVYNNFKIKNAYIKRFKDLENLILIYRILIKLVINKEKTKRQIKVLEKLKHRMGFVLKKRQLIFINNSKSTNIKSSENMINSFRNIHWILGGTLKEYSIKKTTNNILSIRHCYLIGKDYNKFLYYLIKKNVNFSINYNLTKITLLSEKINKGSVLLFPCCASTDQWNNFEKRGKYFVETILIKYK